MELVPEKPTEMSKSLTGMPLQCLRGLIDVHGHMENIALVSTASASYRLHVRDFEGSVKLAGTSWRCGLYIQNMTVLLFSISTLKLNIFRINLFCRKGIVYFNRNRGTRTLIQHFVKFTTITYI